MSPLYGEYISRIMRIAPETDAAAINIQTTTAALLELKSREHEGTALGWAIYGSGNGWHRGTGDFV
jgi:hypothetical protein